MLVIDEDAEQKLVTRLEELRTQTDRFRCIHLLLAGSQPPQGLRERVIQTAQEHLKTSEPHLYFCSDGDIFILAPTIPGREGTAFILDISDFTERPADETSFGFHELPLNIHFLLSALEPKLAKKRQQLLALEQQKQADEFARKRQIILHTSPTTRSEDIKQRRAERTTPQLMMIEDDAFTHRLVENVLQKKFTLTGLHTADKALTTYARLAPDVLFLDIQLPDVTGHELLEKIIALDPEAYVIMLSGNCDRENITRALQLGAKGFVGKPFTREKLFQYIERCPTISHS